MICDIENLVPEVVVFDKHHLQYKRKCGNSFGSMFLLFVFMFYSHCVDSFHQNSFRFVSQVEVDEICIIMMIQKLN